MQALAVVCSGAEGLRELEMPAHWMRDFFLADLCLEMQHNSEGLSRLQVVVMQDILVREALHSSLLKCNCGAQCECGAESSENSQKFALGRV